MSGVRNPERQAYIIETIIPEFVAESATRLSSLIADLEWSPSADVHFLNSGYGAGFIYCKKCFALKPKNTTGNPDFANAHPSPNGLQCNHGFLDWQNPISLHHDNKTDVLRISINPAYRVRDLNEVDLKTLGIVLKEAASRVLQFERKEVGYHIDVSKNELCMYDTSRGGAGFSKQIGERFDEIFKIAVRDILIGSDDHLKKCRGACPECLVSFETQILFQNQNASPNRHSLINALLTGQIINMDTFERFRQEAADKKVDIVSIDSILCKIEQADNVCIVVDTIESENEFTPLWSRCISRISQKKPFKLWLHKHPDKDDEMARELIKRLMLNLGTLAVEIVPKTIVSGIYLDFGTKKESYKAIEWANASLLSVPHESVFISDDVKNSFAWIKDDSVLTSEIKTTTYIDERAKPQVFQGFCEINMGTLRSIDAHWGSIVKKLFGDTLPFNTEEVVSWRYEDRFAKTAPFGHSRPSKVAILSALIEVLGLKNIPGAVVSSAKELQKWKEKAQYNQQPIDFKRIPLCNESSNYEKHDRFFRINLKDNSTVSIGLGKGIDFFVINGSLIQSESCTAGWYKRQGGVN